ncbi:MAG TPA: extracellular solute-binding protein [Rhizomicrobium sp.]|jgi:putative spermidine/putrescine transport system substrate-binding protein|nr:extracellular solute-binding protein [Rhizomicrobium sp.]
MNLRRRVLLALAVLLIAAVASLFFFTRPPPILTVMTWPGPYGRAQTNAQMHTYGADRNVDVRPAFWDGDLSDVQAMVEKRQYKADVIDFELPKAVQACKDGLLEKINPAILPAGAGGVPASRDFVPGAIGPCWVGSQVYSQVIVFSPELKRTPATLADFFDAKKFRGRRALSRASAKFNLEMALLADGVAPGDVYKTLETPEGLDRAFAKLKTLRPIWAHDSVGALEWLKDGQAVMVTALNGDVANLKDFTPGGVIWDHQLYEMDVFGIPAGDPKKDRALDYIAYATASAPLAGVAGWVPFGPARHSSLPLVKPNPETGQAMAAQLPTAPGNFRNAFAVDDGWWLAHGAAIAPRWQEFVSQ